MATVETAREAYLAQYAQIVAWLEGGAPAGQWQRSSRLPGWTLGELAAHVVVTGRVVVDALGGGPAVGPALTLVQYVSGYAAAAAQIAQRGRDRARELAATELRFVARGERDAFEQALAEVHGDPVVAARRGPIKLSDLIATRVVEVVVHSLDLSASAAGDPVALERSAVALTCRALAAGLAENAPGRSVELRVPPYVAVQCVPGPRHTRGTPPNVVETDPVTWIELATGRTHWGAALDGGRLRASGERANLSEYLPVLA